MDIKFNKWMPFKEIYTFDEDVKARGSKFKPINDIIKKPVPGIYLIADSRVGSLKTPESLIYIGKTVGTEQLTSFHERLWKHCCKAIGQCGGKYHFQNGKSQRDVNDETEPQDTEDWASYRNNQFEDFSTWHFSFYCLDERDLEVAKKKIASIEDITMYAYSYYSTLHKTLCNSQSPGKTVKFPWMYKANKSKTKSTLKQTSTKITEPKKEGNPMRLTFEEQIDNAPIFAKEFIVKVKKEFDSVDDAYIEYTKRDMRVRKRSGERERGFVNVATIRWQPTYKRFLLGTALSLGEIGQFGLNAFTENGENTLPSVVYIDETIINQKLTKILECLTYAHKNREHK